MTYRKSLHRAAIILLSGTALAATAAPAYASIGQVITLGVQKSDRAPLDAGQRVETTGAATQIMLNNGTILSFVDAGAFTVETDGSITVHSRSEEHTSELQSLMRISYAVFCLKKKKK